jgi:hypothetical protein
MAFFLSCKLHDEIHELDLIGAQGLPRQKSGERKFGGFAQNSA